MYEVRKIKLDNLFNFSIPSNGSWFTKSFINKNKGNIPVYGATKIPDEVSYGYIIDNLSNVKYFENCLTYNIDGTAGYIFYRRGRFSLSEKVKPLILNEEFKGKVDLNYLKYVLEPLFRRKVKGRKGENGKNEYTKLYAPMIQNLEIEIPINKNGDFDLKKQQDIANKYLYVARMKEILAERKNLIKEIKIDIEDNEKIGILKKFQLRDIFSSKNGNSNYTKAYCKNNPGEYEVFTGTTIGNFGFINTYEYEEDQLTFTTDGEHAGTLAILSGRYNIGGHRAILVPIKSNVNLEYFKYILENILYRKYKKSDVPSVRWNNIKNENVLVPINEAGELDINIQKIISDKYRMIDGIKSEIIKK